MRLEVAEETEAQRLAEALSKPDRCFCTGRNASFSSSWRGQEADDPDEWDEQTFAELVFFLRAWSGPNPNHRPALPEERPRYVPDQTFRRAS